MNSVNHTESDLRLGQSSFCSSASRVACTVLPLTVTATRAEAFDMSPDCIAARSELARP